MKKIVIALLLLVPCFVSAQISALFRSKIDSLSAEHLKLTGGIGFVVGVYDKGYSAIFCYGEKDPGSRESADSLNVFEIGPVTETFTAILFSHLAVNGFVGMDDPLQKYLPVDVPSPVYRKIVCAPMNDIENPYGMGEEQSLKFTPYVCTPDPGEKAQPILLCYLATHTSGLPALPYNLKSVKGKNDPFATYSQNDLYEFLRGYRLLEPIGYDYRHSDLGIAILGHVLSLKMKNTYEQLIEENVLYSLGMTQTKINLGDDLRFRFLNGYNGNGKKVSHWTYDIFAPTGAYHSTPADMMRFLSANLSTHPSPVRDVLNFTHNPRIRVGDPKSGVEEIALGWKVSPLGIEQKRMVWQGGVTGGFSSCVGFVETDHTGVFILSNCAIPVDEMGREILKVMSR